MASLMEKLMKLDRDKLMEIPTEKIKAKQLSEVAGEDIEITVKALSGTLYTELISSATGKNGSIDASKVYDAHAMVVVTGCVEPNLKDKELQAYYKVVSSKDLAKILFPGGELVKISEKIGALSGFGKDDESGESLDYENIKN